MVSFISFLTPLRLLGFFFMVFIFLGIQHFASFETTDEHFWKYERVPAYWQALAKGDWKKTAINDKPGVSVALVSGIGLSFADPTEHRVRDERVTADDALTIYDSARTERINWALRFPLLLANGLLLILLFFAVRGAVADPWIALGTVVLSGLSPLLLGIARILNPDTLLWSTSAVALFGFLAFLQAKRPAWLVGATTAAGLSILSKYTGNLLFPLVFSFTIGYFLMHKEESVSHLRRSLVGFLAFWLGSAVVYALLMPAALVKPALWWKGTLGFLMTGYLLPFLISLVILLLALIHFRPHWILSLRDAFQRSILPWLHWLLMLPILFFLSVFLFGLGSQPWLPLQALMESAKEGGELIFPMLAGDPAPLAWLKQMLVQAYPLVFSLPPLTYGLILIAWLRHIRRPAPALLLPMLGLSLFAPAYFAAALGQGVLTNARYAIILFPFFAFFAAIGLKEVVHSLPERSRVTVWPGALLSLLLLATITVVGSEPFPFNYASPFLSKNFALHDGWGYGQYEAAQFLNALPRADETLVWSDRNGLCQFLTGPKCLSGYKIDTERFPPDYFVLSKRGQERNYIARDKKTGAPLFAYASAIPRAIWRLDILERPGNFLVIVPAR